MKKKSLFFLGFLFISIISCYYLNTSFPLNQSSGTNNFGVLKNPKIPTILPFISKTNIDAPEKILAGTFTITAIESQIHVCNQTSGNTGTFTFDYDTVGYNENTALSISGEDPALVTAGVVYTFTPASPLGSTSGQFTVEVSNLDTLPIGSYNFTVDGVGDGGTGATDSETVTLVIDTATVGITTLSTPSNGATNVPVTGTTFTGIGGSGAAFFSLQVSEDPTFPFPSLVIDAQITGGSPYVSTVTLKYGTVYYWRVRGSNDCDFGTYTDSFSFQTEVFVDSCTSEVGGTNIAIIDPGTTTDVINIVPNITLSDVNVTVDISHQFTGNLTVSLQSPLGTEVILYDQSCGSSTAMTVTFDDEASSNYNCVITTSARPSGSLSNFDGENSSGNWTLKIVDHVSGNFGTLNSWSLELCQSVAGSSTNSVLLPHDDFNFVAGSVGSEIVPLHLEATSAGSTAAEQVFTITQLPTYTLLLSGVAFNTVGQTFTQEDINNNLITYDNTAVADEVDTFIVNITNATSGFLGNQVITLNLWLDANLGVDDEFFEKTGISIYPTVSNGSFNIQSSQYIGKTMLELYTITGLKVYDTLLDFNSSHLQEIHIPSLASGIYILKLTTDTLEGSQKIIIK
jgi:subtilisin-like proprotein convertase family protein